jgi:hypothetical protein
MWSPPPDHPLHRLFTGLTEQTFFRKLGLPDPQLTDYLSGLLTRFVHINALYRLRDARGRKLEEVAEMLIDAESLPAQGSTRREVHRHIGDFTLFWTGVYPESLSRLRSALTRDHLIDYTEQGKRSYYIASTFENDPYTEEAPILRRLSEHFELCAYGLNQVRHEWERQRPDANPPTSN